MSTSPDYIEYICNQIKGTGNIRYKKMFGEYMIYVNDKPVLLVCNNTVFVKKLDCLADKMKNMTTGIPYQGAKEHYVFDVEDADFAREIIGILESVTPVPKPKKKKTVS